MDGQAYYESLVAQDYQPEEAAKYTQQHYPGFAPTSPVMPAPQPMAAPTPQPIASGMPVQQMHPSQIGTIVQPAAAPSTSTSKGMRITNGIFGILMSLMLIFYSLWVIGLWAEVSEDIEENAEIFELASDHDSEFAELYDGLESFVSTISLFYYAILLLSIGIFVIAIVQFLNKPWGTKALLSSTGLVLVLLLITGTYEASYSNQLSEDYEAATNEPLEDMPTFSETNGVIGGYCAGLCLVIYGLLAFIGRPKSPPGVLVMN